MSNGISDLREFGSCRLDVGKKFLWCREKPVSLPLKAIELLTVLVEKNGEVVTKEEIWQTVWQNAFVEETNLTHNIYLLRKTLKDLGETGLIQTVPRRGYRFAGEVHRRGGAGEIVIEKHRQTRTLIEIREAEQEKKAPGNLKRTLRSRILASVAVALLLIAGIGAAGFHLLSPDSAGSGIQSIAVLPFKTVGVQRDDGQKGLGLTDVLITRLSNIRRLKVRPTSAILNFAGQDSITAGQKLLVDAVLEGTIQRSGERILVTVRLVRITDRSVVWSGHFEKLSGEEFQLQNEIARQVVDSLALNLSGAEETAFSKVYTKNPDAYELYQQGRFHWNKRNWEGMIEAARLFRNAIDHDPQFALAYVGLADTTGTQSDPTEAFAAVRRALELDPSLAEAHASLGFLQMFHQWKWKEAENSLKKAIELNPNYATAHHWYATLLAIRGKTPEAKAEMHRALEINPLSYNFLADLGQIHYFAGEYREAEELCRKSLEIYPDFQFAHNYLADIYLKTGRYERMVEEKIISNRINFSFIGENSEEKNQIKARAAEQKRIFREEGFDQYMRFNLAEPVINSYDFYANAEIYAFLGKKEKALDNLEKAFKSRVFMAAFIKADPIFENLRTEKRFREILHWMDLGETTGF